MTLQKLYSYLRQAVDDYHMIEEGDKIAIGVSGGKDSLTLLYGLAGLRRFYPKPFTLAAITVDLGYEDFAAEEIKELCAKLDVEYHVVKTAIKDRLSKGECSLCARLRKGALNEKALEAGCNKVAYAHNRDDVIETMLLSLLHEGRFSCFYPVTAFEDSGIAVIRPLIYVPLAQVIGFQNKMQLPVIQNPCPYDRETERAYIRELIGHIVRHIPDARKSMFTAVKNGNLEGWKIEEAEPWKKEAEESEMEEKRKENEQQEIDEVISMLDKMTGEEAGRIKVQFSEEIEEGNYKKEYHHGRCDVGSPFATGKLFDFEGNDCK